MQRVTRGLIATMFLFGLTTRAAASRVYPMPADEPRSADFTVVIDGTDSFVSEAKVAVPDAETRAKVVDDFAHFGTLHETAAFTAFDLGERPSDVVVAYKEPIREIHVLPASANVEATIVGERQVKFRVDRPMNLTVEINGDTVRSLHVFANPAERDAPDAKDPKVRYFGPGVHEVDGPIDINDGQTLYLAGGAILRAVSEAVDRPSFACTAKARRSAATGSSTGRAARFTPGNSSKRPTFRTRRSAASSCATRRAGRCRCGAAIASPSTT